MLSAYFDIVMLAFLVVFACWITWLSMKLYSAIDIIDGSDDQLIEIQQSVELVAQILNRLPDLMRDVAPQFTMNTSPLQPIIDAFAKRFSGEGVLRTLAESPLHGEGQEEQGPTP